MELTKDERKRVLGELSRGLHGKALRELLEERYATLSDLTTIKTWDETLGRQLAISLIKDIFAFLDEKPAVVPNRNQYM